MTSHSPPGPSYDQLYRRESGRILSALVRIIGAHHLDLAQDAVQDAFSRALEVWHVRGAPDNPAAWLMTTARNRALDALRRERTARDLAPGVVRALEEAHEGNASSDPAAEADTRGDEQLRMMFSCCHPALAQPTQIALVLNVLCGFGASEIAAAFLVSRAAVEKRLARGRKTLAAARHLFDPASGEFEPRLAGVQRALYLLFNEGHQGSSIRGGVRSELCGEALRLVTLLRGFTPAATPATDALAALMLLHAARQPARTNAAGQLCSLADQDRARWDASLLTDGLALFELSASGSQLSTYHVEAAIVVAHMSADRLEGIGWDAIVALYDRLMVLSPSPVVALNRAIAIAEAKGAERGFAALNAIGRSGELAAYPFYAASLADLELRRGNRDRARRHFLVALAQARNATERQFIVSRLRATEDRIREVAY